MFILESRKQLEKAVAKAQKIKPVIRMISFGVYIVRGTNGNSYTVKCERTTEGEKQVSCDCRGGERGLVCYHASAALELHGTLAKHRQISLV